MNKVKQVFKWQPFIKDGKVIIPRQEHIILEGFPENREFYRVFGEGSERYARQVISSSKQPKVTSKKKLKLILDLLDNFESPIVYSGV